MSARVLAFVLLASCEATAAVKLGAVREIGGSNIDRVSALTRDAAGNLYITGKTYSVDFPATTGQTRPGGSTLWRIDGGKQLNPLFGHGAVGVHALAASPSALYVHTGGALLKSTDSGLAVSVQAGSTTSSPLLMPGTTAAPAIYTQDGSGTGLSLIFNEDGSLNTSDSPATQGSVISIACNGVGSNAPVNVYIDGSLGQLVDAESQSLPGLPGSALILRVRIPAPDATHPPMPPIVSVMLNVGGVSNRSGILSPPYVAVAIKQ